MSPSYVCCVCSFNHPRGQQWLGASSCEFPAKLQCPPLAGTLGESSRVPRMWGSPKASHIKASHPYFPHFPRFCVHIFRVFRAFVLRGLLWVRPLFSWGGRDVRIFRIFPASGLNRWFRKSDRPALGWPALGDWEHGGFRDGGVSKSEDI